jgi:hypothetical protein
MKVSKVQLIASTHNPGSGSPPCGLSANLTLGDYGRLADKPDPTGNGGVLPGFGDQREIELLVEAGFTPVEAMRRFVARHPTALAATFGVVSNRQKCLMDLSWTLIRLLAYPGSVLLAGRTADRLTSG